ncbi:hypothetical protein [Consotaella aegiceratis]|uniref:hypothetical protein n=1 Tax=Consotaella aegiceratis TaxID=3097961 RepID=UPI002F416DF4
MKSIFRQLSSMKNRHFLRLEQRTKSGQPSLSPWPPSDGNVKNAVANSHLPVKSSPGAVVIAPNASAPVVVRIRHHKRIEI